MFFSQTYPILMNAGVLNPVTTDLVISGVYNRCGATPLAVGDVVMFDFCMENAEVTSWNPEDGPASVFGNVTLCNDGATVFNREGVAVYAVAQTVAADNATVTVRVIGIEPNMTKAASATTAKGSCFVATHGGALTVSVCAAASATSKKIIAICDGKGTNTTTFLNAFFNGFGFGLDI